MGCRSSKNIRVHCDYNNERNNRSVRKYNVKQNREKLIESIIQRHKKLKIYDNFIKRNPNIISPLIKGIVGNYWDLGVHENRITGTRLGWRREHIRGVLRTVPYASEFRILNNIPRMTTKKHMMDYIDYLADRGALRVRIYYNSSIGKNIYDKSTLQFCVYRLNSEMNNERMELMVKYDNYRTLEAIMKLKDKRFSIIRHRFAYRITRLGRGM